MDTIKILSVFLFLDKFQYNHNIERVETQCSENILKEVLMETVNVSDCGHFAICLKGREVLSDGVGFWLGGRFAPRSSGFLFC